MAQQSRKWFYNSRAWKTIRQQALRRDGYTCQICGRRATEVHHLIELDDDNVHDKQIALNINNLQSLCRDCHMQITQEEHKRFSNGAPVGYHFDADGFLIPMSANHD